MTTFNVGDRVRFEGVVDSVKVGVEYNVRVMRSGRYWWMKKEQLELVAPIRVTPKDERNKVSGLIGIFDSGTTDSSTRVKRNMEMDAMEELEAFKAKVVEVLDETVPRFLDDNEMSREIKDALGLTLRPSRYRVTFEVEAEGETEARELARNSMRNLTAVTVEKIEEE